MQHVNKKAPQNILEYIWPQFCLNCKKKWSSGYGIWHCCCPGQCKEEDYDCESLDIVGGNTSDETDSDEYHSEDDTFNSNDGVVDEPSLHIG